MQAGTMERLGLGASETATSRIAAIERRPWAGEGAHAIVGPGFTAPPAR